MTSEYSGIRGSGRCWKVHSGFGAVITGLEEEITSQHGNVASRDLGNSEFGWARPREAISRKRGHPRDCEPDWCIEGSYDGQHRGSLAADTKKVGTTGVTGRGRNVLERAAGEVGAPHTCNTLVWVWSG